MTNKNDMDNGISKDRKDTIFLMVGIFILGLYLMATTRLGFDAVILTILGMIGLYVGTGLDKLDRIEKRLIEYENKTIEKSSKK